MTATLVATPITPVVWDSGLPAPLMENAAMVSGNNIKRRKCQDGSYEQRRFGSGAPDRWQMTWRLTATEHDDFRAFWRDDLDFGTKWLYGSWLDLLGYSSSYAARIVGYPNEAVRRFNSGSSGHADISCSVIVALAANLYTIGYTGSIDVDGCSNAWGTL